MGGLTINRDPPKEVEAYMKADRRLCITQDGRIVEQGDPDAAYLWRVEGKDISKEEAKEYGLGFEDGKVVLKARSKPEDKAIKKSEAKTSKADDDDSEKPEKSSTKKK